jgi:hypothetical protein
MVTAFGAKATAGAQTGMVRSPPTSVIDRVPVRFGSIAVPEVAARDVGGRPTSELPAMPTVGRLVAVALIAAFVIWRLVLALSRGGLKLFDPFFWTKPNYASLFDGPVVTRDRNPLGYWFGVVSQIVISSLFLWIFISMYLQRISP